MILAASALDFGLAWLLHRYGGYTPEVSLLVMATISLNALVFRRNDQLS